MPPDKLSGHLPSSLRPLSPDPCPQASAPVAAREQIIIIIIIIMSYYARRQPNTTERKLYRYVNTKLR